MANFLTPTSDVYVAVSIQHSVSSEPKEVQAAGGTVLSEAKSAVTHPIFHRKRKMFPGETSQKHADYKRIPVKAHFVPKSWTFHANSYFGVVKCHLSVVKCHLSNVNSFFRQPNRLLAINADGTYLQHATPRAVTSSRPVSSGSNEACR